MTDEAPRTDITRGGEGPTWEGSGGCRSELSAAVAGAWDKKVALRPRCPPARIAGPPRQSEAGGRASAGTSRMASHASLFVTTPTQAWPSTTRSLPAVLSPCARHHPPLLVRCLPSAAGPTGLDCPQWWCAGRPGQQGSLCRRPSPQLPGWWWCRGRLDAMSFRRSLPTLPSADARVHREEDITAARLASQRSSHAVASLESAAPISAMARADVSRDTPSPAMSPAPLRRHVVVPDPVAFKYEHERFSAPVMASC